MITDQTQVDWALIDFAKQAINWVASRGGIENERQRTALTVLLQAWDGLAIDGVIGSQTIARLIERNLLQRSSYMSMGRLNVDLPIPYYSQRDNFTQAWRTCNSSACAMAAKYLGAAIADDNDYLERVLKVGDTTQHTVQTRVLNGLGIPSTFRMDLDFIDLDKSPEQGQPVVIGILHKGPLKKPKGGHMILVKGRTDRGAFICHDPWGDIHSEYENHDGRDKVFSRALLKYRWLVGRSHCGWGRLFTVPGN